MIWQTHHNPKYVVRYVPAGVAERVRGGVGEDDGGGGDVEDLAHGVAGHVGQVDQHPQPVHLLHHVLPEVADPACPRGELTGLHLEGVVEEVEVVEG